MRTFGRTALRFWILLGGIVALPGCGDDDSSADGASDAGPGDGGATDTGATTTTSSTSTAADGTGAGSDGGDIAALYDCDDPGFAEVQPLSGPGYDPVMGLLDPVQDTYVVHTTQLFVKPDEASQGEFLEHAGAISAQLAETPGLVAFSLGVEPTCGFSRTLGIWRSEMEMFQFVTSGAHLDAMGRILDISITGKTTHWEAGAAELPVTWEQAMDRLDETQISPVYD